MKTYFRLGSFYQADTPSLEGDLDISEMIAAHILPANEPAVIEQPTCNCKSETLTKQIADLTEQVNKKPLPSITAPIDKVKEDKPLKVKPKPAAKKK